MDASTVRLGGETDRIYQERVSAAFTGTAQEGRFAIGLHQVKLVRLYPEEAPQTPAAEGAQSPAGEAEAKKTPER